MKTALRLLGGLVLLLVLAIGGGLLYLNLAFPKVSPAENLKIETTPQRLARGKYLVENVTGCMGCHSQRDFNYYAGPIKNGTLGAGGFRFDHEMMGLPGTLFSKNITPYHLKDWTDGELVRTLRAGVNKQGEALFPLMPYGNYSGLSQEDLYSVVTYIRGLEPIAYDPTARHLEFPMSLIVKTIPHDPGPYPKDPDPKNALEYGRYLMNATGCMNCHTPMDDHGQPLQGMDLAGGMEFHFPDGSTERSINITPDKATGIGDWSKDAFIKRFRLGKKMAESKALVKAGEMNPLMPWEEYGGMRDEDLGALYEYLHNSVKPVKHAVEKFTPPGAK